MEEWRDRRIGRWRLLDPIGCGQSGTVYEVREVVAPFRRAALKIHAGRRVKVDRAAFCREADFVARQMIAGLMPAFYGRGECADGTPYFVMAYAERVPSGLTRDETVAIVGRLAEALECLDAAGFTHGDVKPANVGLIDGQAVLLDFGSVCSHAEAAAAAIRVGTPYYAASELQRGGAVSALTDVFSLGRTLEELQGDADDLVFGPVVHHACAFDPTERPQSLAAFRRELREAVANYRRTVARESRIEKFKVVARRVAFAALATAVVYGLVASASYQVRRLQIRAERARSGSS